MSVRRALLAPLRRDGKTDFAHGVGGELLVAKTLQVLGTEGDTARTTGELPWRTAFGSALHLLRHRNATDVVRELARIYARDAMARWLPEVRLLRCTLTSEETTLAVQLAVGDDETAAAGEAATLALEDGRA